MRHNCNSIREIGELQLVKLRCLGCAVAQVPPPCYQPIDTQEHENKEKSGCEVDFFVDVNADGENVDENPEKPCFELLPHQEELRHHAHAACCRIEIGKCCISESLKEETNCADTADQREGKQDALAIGES